MKVPSGDFTKEELEFLWDQHNEALKTFEEPKERYTRFLSDLIKRVRDISLRLIQAGAIEGLIEKDTAHYVKTKLKERGVPLSNHFYEYFKPEEKREWQLDDQEEVKPSDHKHEFQSLGKINGMGEVSRCGAPCIPACSAMIIDGRLFEQQELEEKDPELKITKPKMKYEEENEFYITPYENVISRLKAVVCVWRNTASNLTDAEKKKLKQDLFYMEKAGEFLDMAYDRKNLIDPFTQHLLTMMYVDATQKNAGGGFLMYRIDLAKRKHGESVKTFKKAGDFAKLLSGKQTTKAMKGMVRKLNPRYEPKIVKDAQDSGFTGQQCNDCEFWRVGYDRVLNPDYDEKKDPIHEKFTTMLICFHCGEIQKHKLFKLPKQTPMISQSWNSAEMTEEEKQDYKSFKKNNDYDIKFYEKNPLNNSE